MVHNQRTFLSGDNLSSLLCVHVFIPLQDNLKYHQWKVCFTMFEELHQGYNIIHCLVFAPMSSIIIFHNIKVFLRFSIKLLNAGRPFSGTVFGSDALRTREYCKWEIFNATCRRPDHVIIMRSARYGRMRFGRYRLL